MQGKQAGVAVATVILSAAIGTDAQDTKLSLPNVTVTAPAPPIRAALPTRSCEILCTEPLLDRYRVEEDKFKEVPCAATRIASSSGGKCLQGYRLPPAAFEVNRSTRSGSTCELALPRRQRARHRGADGRQRRGCINGHRARLRGGRAHHRSGSPPASAPAAFMAALEWQPVRLKLARQDRTLLVRDGRRKARCTHDCAARRVDDARKLDQQAVARRRGDGARPTRFFRAYMLPRG